MRSRLAIASDGCPFCVKACPISSTPSRKARIQASALELLNRAVILVRKHEDPRSRSAIMTAGRARPRDAFSSSDLVEPGARNQQVCVPFVRRGIGGLEFDRVAKPCSGTPNSSDIVSTYASVACGAASAGSRRIACRAATSARGTPPAAGGSRNACTAWTSPAPPRHARMRVARHGLLDQRCRPPELTSVRRCHWDRACR
jgi:hypothetical protein